jgi:hypothetical protein
MRRTIFLALLAALLLASPARAAGPIQVIRDCEDDGALQGHYTPSELRKARSQLPTDIDEYSDCRDVLSRAIAAAASSKSSGRGSGTGGGGGSDTSSSTATPTPSTQPNASSLSDSSTESGKLPAPYTPNDHAAVAQAAANGAKPVDLNGHKVAPGTHLAAEVGRNDIPGTLLAVLALSGAALIATAGPTVRRRVIARRQP